MSFADLGLLPELLRAVTDAGYTEPTPIQAKAIPIVLQGHDVMGGAQTGTGKTAGFTLPLLQKLARHANSSPSPAKHPVRALILAPTRELAMQVHENVVMYSKFLPLRSTCIYGGVDMKAQIAELKEGREIIVATPGRLLDHVQQKTVNFNQVEMLVLDEADRMLDMGFIPDIKRILALLPKERQSLLFSATFSDEIKKLADTMLKAPQLIEVAKRNTVSETITHRMHPVATDLKRSLLTWLIQHNDLQQALVFCGTKFGASRIASYLNKQGITADAIHGDKSQNERTKALEAFKAGTIRILVATDVAARGIDIDELPTVINYELPHTAEDYVHRIGRTGRAGKKGEATSLVAPEEAGRLADIEKLIKLKIERVVIDGFDQAAPQHTEARQDGKRERGPRSERNERNERRDAPAQSSERGERRQRRPEQDMPRRIPHMDAASAHLPKLDFDPNKPYESRTVTEETAGANKPSLPGRNRRAPVAALLGGLTRKP